MPHDPRKMAMIVLICSLAGCESVDRDSSGQTAANEPPPKRETVAIVAGAPVSWTELRPMLVEAAGGDVLSEYVLDSQVVAELESKNMAVTEQDIKDEKSIMLRQLSPEADQAVRLLNQLRDRLHLGPRRFDLFLRRYAGLRKLIADQVEVTDAMVRQAHEQRYAQLSVCRMIVVETLRDAAEVRRRLDAGDLFIDLAIELSKDSSRNQGGLLPPISPHDATFPSGITVAASKLGVNEISDPIALDAGFAILRCENKITPDAAPFEAEIEELRTDVRLSVERSLMARKARVLLDGADVTVLNADLDREFKRRLRQAAEPE